MVKPQLTGQCAVNDSGRLFKSVASRSLAIAAPMVCARFAVRHAAASVCIITRSSVAVFYRCGRSSLAVPSFPHAAHKRKQTL